MRGNSVIEGTLEQVTSDDGASVLKDMLEHIADHPFDLNKVTADELALVPDVTLEDARAIIDLRKRVGRFSSVQQLRVMEEIGPRVYAALEPFVAVHTQPATLRASRSRPVVEVRARILRDMISREEGEFRGSMVKSYSRLVTVPSEHIEAGALFEKDAGERFVDGFASAYVAAKDVLFLSRIVAGDFTVENGQGLVFWSPTSFAKGADVIRAVRKSGSDARPYRSTNEFNFLRGVAVQARQSLGFGLLEVMSFGSSRHLSATINESNAVLSLDEDGLLRNDAEIRKRNQVHEQMFGGAVHVRGEDSWKIGASVSAGRYDHPFVSDDAFAFTGNAFTIVGVDGQAVVGRLSTFVEAARSEAGGLAMLGGGVIRFSNEVHASVAYRDYSTSFHNPHAAGFGEYGDVTNERGFYFGVDASPARWLRIRTYVDQFARPWRTSTIPFPSKGYDLFVQADVDVSQRLNLLARAGTKTTSSAETYEDAGERENRILDDRRQHRVRLHAVYHVNRQLSVAGRVEATFISYGTMRRKETGHLVFQEIQYRDRARFSIQGRLIFFDTDSYDSRVYEYEAELRGTSSIPPLYGKGIRYYLVIAYPLPGGFLLSGKFADTHVLDGEFMIPHDRQVSLQIDCSF